MKSMLVVLLALGTACSNRRAVAEGPAEVEVSPVEDVVEVLSDEDVQVDAQAAVEPAVVDWELMDVGALSPLGTTACDGDVQASWEEIARAYRTTSERDADQAARIHKVALGCMTSEEWEIAGALARVLRRPDAEPIDGYVAATVAAAIRAAHSEPCGGGTLWDILVNVRIAAGPEYSARMLADPNFEPVHNTYGWRLATMPGPDRTVERLTGTTWYNCGACGVYGDIFRYRLESGGTGVYRSAEIDADDEGVSWNEVPITWTIDGNQVTITREGEQKTMTLEPETGLLKMESGASYRDHEDECSA